MTDIAAHIHIFAQNPDDDFVTKRTAAIKALSSKFAKGNKGVPIYIRTANDIAEALEAKGALPAEITADIAAAISKEASSFVPAGKELELKVVGALGVISAIEAAKPSTGNLSTTDLLGVCCWSALSFQKPLSETKLESLRSELMNKGRELIEKSASVSRKRVEVEDFDCPLPKEATPAATKAAIDDGAKGIIAALRANAALDREEIDFLWWALSGWSAALSRRYSAPQGREAAAIAAGLEAGSMLRRMPAEAHKQLALRLVEGDEKHSLGELIALMESDLPALANAIPNNEVIAQCPQVFPLISALLAGKAENSGKSKVKRSMTDWASRALLEAAILRLAQHPSGVDL
jgi:hypothetical protein